MGNNPIKRIDPDGRYWLEKKDKSTADEMRDKYSSLRNYYEKRGQKFQDRIDKGKNIAENEKRKDWNPQNDRIETEAYSRQYALNSTTMPYINTNGSFSFPIVRQMGYYDITKENIFNIFNIPLGLTPAQAATDPGNYIYRHGN